MNRASRAVVAQVAMGAGNTALYFSMTYFLKVQDSEVFSQVFAAAAFSLAIAELGLSFSAPSFLSKLAAKVVAANVAMLLYISQGLYWLLFSLISLFFLGSSVFSYVYIPFVLANSLLLPAWAILFLELENFAIRIAVMRLLIVLTFFALPPLLFLAPILYIGSTVAVLRRCREWPKLTQALAVFRKISSKLAIARTASFGAYSSVPILLNLFLGPSAGHAYLFFDRCKAFVSTIIQPLVQSMFLSRISRAEKKVNIWKGLVLASLFCFAITLTIYYAGVNLGFAEVQEQGFWSFLFACSSLSAFSTIIVHFWFLIRGNQMEFLIGLYLQSVCLGLVFAGCYIFKVSAFWIPLSAEAALLAACLYFYLRGVKN